MAKNKKDGKVYTFDSEIIYQSDNEITIKISGEFVSASRPRITKFGNYIAEPYKSYKKYFSMYMKTMFSNIGTNFIDKSLSVDISFYKPIPKSYSKPKKELSLRGGCITRPDIDNYYKAVLDSIDTVFYSDDSFIVELSGRKLYTEEENGFIILKIKEFKNGEKC